MDNIPAKAEALAGKTEPGQYLLYGGKTDRDWWGHSRAEEVILTGSLSQRGGNMSGCAFPWSIGSGSMSRFQLQ